jgi:uncharacterized protein DUF6527
MKLSELEPEFIQYVERDGRVYLHHVSAFGEAHGIYFLCPHCYRKNSGPVGTHGIMVWGEDMGAPDHAHPRPARWKFSGTNFDDLTLTPSIDVSTSCGWHGWITNGEAIG